MTTRLAGRPATETDGLLRDAVHVLVDNWHGHSTVPSRGLYPHQWSWDSAFIALGLRHWAPQRAATELLSLFGAQWSDGRIPHIAFNPAVDPDAYFPGPTFWRSADVVGHPPIDTSGIIQPPVHATAAVAVVDGLGEDGLAFARRAYPCLVAQHDYLRRRRSVGPAGLAAVVHPWETGMDNSPAWDTPLHAVPADLSLFDTYTRRDLEHAGTGERPTDEDYARYIRLALAYRDHGYDDDWVRAESEFCVVDPTFNALWAWAEIALADLAGADRRRPDRAPGRGGPAHPGPGRPALERRGRGVPGPGRPDRPPADRAHRLRADPAGAAGPAGRRGRGGARHPGGRAVPGRPGVTGCRAST